MSKKRDEFLRSVQYMEIRIITTFDYKKHSNILAAKALYIAFRSSLILSASEFFFIKKEVFQITVGDKL